MVSSTSDESAARGDPFSNRWSRKTPVRIFSRYASAVGVGSRLGLIFDRLLGQTPFLDHHGCHFARQRVVARGREMHTIPSAQLRNVALRISAEGCVLTILRETFVGVEVIRGGIVLNARVE